MYYYFMENNNVEENKTNNIQENKNTDNNNGNLSSISQRRTPPINATTEDNTLSEEDVAKISGVNSVENIMKREEEKKMWVSWPNSFEDKRKKYKSLLWSVQNKTLLKTFLKRDSTIDEQIAQVENIKEIESKIKDINNSKLKNFLITSMKDIWEDKILEYISDSKNAYQEMERHQNKIVQWKIILEHIRSWKTLTKWMLSNISDILEKTPKNIASELWLDLWVFKTSLSSYFRSKKQWIWAIWQQIKNENRSIQKDIDDNVKWIKSEIDILRDRKTEIDVIIKEAKWDEQKELWWELLQIKEKLAEKTPIYTERVKNIKKRLTSLREKQIEHSEELNELNSIEDYLISTRKVELKNSEYDIPNNIKSIFIDEYNESLPKLEKVYREQMSEEDYIFIDNISQKIRDTDIDVEEIKKKYEQNSRKRHEKALEDKNKYEEWLDKVAEWIVKEDIKINDEDSILVKAQKVAERGWSILKAWSVKLDYIAKNALEEEWIDTTKNKWLSKNILLAVSNIQTRIDGLNDEYSKYMKSWEYDEKKASEYKFRIKWYTDLKDKLQDERISLWDKDGLLSLLWKWKWLWEYINHRSNNYWYNIDYITKEVKNLRTKKYSGKWWLEENTFVKLYEKWMEEQKFSLIENFSKLKSEIPQFEGITLWDDLYKQAQLLWINDDESLIKIEKLKLLQDNVKNINLDLYTKDFIDNSLEYVRLQKESEIERLKSEKREELGKIDRLPIEQHEKDAQKSDYLDFYEKKLAEIESDLWKIESEKSFINELNREKWFFNKSELKDISNNMWLFGIVWNIEEYSEIIAGLSEDIIEWNTDFITFENYKNIKSDFYTTSKLNELVSKQQQLLKDNIDLIGNDIELIKLKENLIKDRLEIDEIERKLKNGEILENDVLDLLSNESLYKLSLQEKNKEILEKLKNPDTLPNEIDSLKQELKDNTEELKQIKQWEIDNTLKTKISNNSEKYDLDRDLIQKEISDWFNNSNTINDGIFSRYKWYGSNVFQNAKDRIDWFKELKKKTKIVKQALFWGADPRSESSKNRKTRHEHIDKYLDAAFSTWFAYIIIWIFKAFNTGSHAFIWIPRYLQWVRDSIDKNRTWLFWFTALIIFIIVAFSSKNDLTFVYLNTHLYSLNNYISESGNIKFSEWMWWGIETFFYKTNIFLFFLFLIVLYQIIIEFLYKYIKILKNPIIWIEHLLESMLKLLVFFLFMWILFKVNTFIL